MAMPMAAPAMKNAFVESDDMMMEETRAGTLSGGQGLPADTMDIAFGGGATDDPFGGGPEVDFDDVEIRKNLNETAFFFPI